MNSVFYNGGVQTEPTYGQVQDFKALVDSGSKGSKRKAKKLANRSTNRINKDTAVSGEDKEMAENQVAEQDQEQNQQSTESAGGKLRIQRTVFDLDAFDDVLLLKFVDAPAPPKSIQEALAMVDGKTDKLLQLIGVALAQELRQKEYDAIEGFRYVSKDSKDGSGGDEYKGNYASGDKKDLINAAVLNFAKVLGWTNDLGPEKKEAIKNQVKDMIRKNPEMVKSLMEAK